MAKCSLDEVKKTYNQAWDDNHKKVFSKIGDVLSWADDNIENYFSKGLSFVTGMDEADAKRYIPRIFTASKVGEVVADTSRALRQAYTEANAQARKIQEYLKRIPDEDNLQLFRALDGDLDPSELKPSLQETFQNVKGVIDHWQDRLVEAGMLAPEARKDYYVVRLYKQYYDDLRNPNSDMRKKIDKLYKRKNLTMEQRTMLGQLTDPSIVVPMTILKQRSQLAKGEFFRTLSEKLGSDEPKEGYEMIPDIDVGGGVKKFGALSGKYAPQELLKSLYLHDELRGAIGDSLNLMEKITSETPYTKLIDHLKVNMTAKNPVTHMFNVLSNLNLSFINGDLGNVAKVVYSLAFNREKFNQLRALGDQVGINSQLTDFETLNHLVINEPETREKSPLRGFLTSLFKNLYMAQGSKAGDFIRKAYDWEDKIFKLAALQKHLDEGRTLEEAGRLAQEAYVDYQTALPNAWRAVDKLGVMPFSHYIYKATPATLKAITRSPMNLVRFGLVQVGLMSIGGSIFSNDDDAYKPSWAKSSLNAFFSKEWVNLNGTDYFFNIGRMLPGGKFNVFDIYNSDTNLSLGFVGSLSNILQGKNSLGYDIHGKYDDVFTQLWRKFEVAGETFLPSYFPLGRFPQRALDLAQGDLKNYYKEDMSVEEFMARQLGVRRFNTIKEYDQKLKRAENKLKQKQRELSEGKISNDAYNKYYQEYIDSYTRITQSQLLDSGFF